MFCVLRKVVQMFHSAVFLFSNIFKKHFQYVSNSSLVGKFSCLVLETVVVSIC